MQALKLEDVKQLPREWETGAFVFKVKMREGTVLLIEKSSKGHEASCYEVVRTKLVPDEVIKGRFYEAREVMPSNEEWGSRGWTFTDRMMAIRRFNELTGETEMPEFG